MIDFKKKKGSEIYEFVVDGEVIDGVSIDKRAFERDNYQEETIAIIADNRIAGEKVISKINEDFPKFNHLVVKNWGIYDEIEFNYFTYNPDYKDGAFHLIYNIKDWKYSFSFDEYYIEFSRIWGTGIFVINEDWRVKESENKVGFEFSFSMYNSIKPILDTILESQAIITQFHKEAIDRLLNANNSQSVLASFNFSDEIKVPCEQYLLYFARFLRDLGINATSNLKEEAGKVLFSVTPTDDIEALDKIREALAIYLSLPSSPIEYNDSFAAMRLQQQIENLQHSQRMAVRELQFNEKLLIAQSETIREKNLTISQQQSVIEQKDKIIEKISSKSIMIDSAENKEELEEIYNGLKIGESKFLKEQLGIHLNPAKVIKTAVKNTFGKDEKISILDSDEETDKK